MNRTERLYALVEELRAVAPRPRSASWLANRFGVSVRTVVGDHLAGLASPAVHVIEDGLAAGRVLSLSYTDSAGAHTQRDVEPLGLLWGPHGWYLAGWCRLRRGVRGFALDRVAAASLTDESVPDRRGALAAELDRLAAEPLVP